MSFTFKTKTITEKSPSVFDARKKPFTIHGLWHPERGGVFRRMPEEIAKKTSGRVHTLYTNTAGARLRFATDSGFVAVGAIYPPMQFPSERTAALSGAGAFCFDLYSDGEHISVMYPQSIRQSGSVVSFDLGEGRYESVMTFPERKMREITLCFPSFVDISELYVGLEEGAALFEAEPYKNENPVVFYGSSITQGACASRSGNTYQNILSRRLGFDYINLGFAGGCLAEEAIIDYLCTLDAPIFVFDYDHNTPSVEYLEKTHLPALRKIRAAHPNMPIVLMSKPNLQNGRAVTEARRDVIEKSFRTLREESCAPIYFIDGLKAFESRDSEMMTVDGTHPTDLGFYCIADALYEVLKLYY